MRQAAAARLPSAGRQPAHPPAGGPTTHRLLQEAGCTSFLRVGPLRRIAAPLLPQSLHATSGKTSADAELKVMLAEAEAAGDSLARALLARELAQAQAGAERRRRRLLRSVPIVGTTCCSALLSTLEGQAFDVVILDECSQARGATGRGCRGQPPGAGARSAYGCPPSLPAPLSVSADA